MSVFDRLKEGIFRVRVIPKQAPEDVTEFTDEKHSLPNQMEEATQAGKRIDLFNIIPMVELFG